MSELKTNFNVAPYNDDYDEDKEFYKILFRPSTAVQARELTQLQSILQNQISRHGSYNFKNGAIVDGCGIIYHDSLQYVHLVDSFDSNNQLAANTFNSSYLITNGANNTTSVRAVIKVAKNGYTAQYPNTNRWYLDYIKTGKDGSNNDVFTFSSGQTLHVYSANQAKFGTLDANNLIDTIDIITANGTANATGMAYGIGVTDGTIYQKGFFLKVLPQTILVKDFDQNPNNYVVGFDTTETIVTPEQDSSLYDNSLGSPNTNAPGAHRLKMTPILVAKPKTEVANNKNFFAIVEFDSVLPTEQNLGEEGLNRILDVLANRTKEESGDYVVTPFNIETFADSSNTFNFQYEVSSGIGYFSGYRKEKINPVRVTVPRALTVRESEAEIVTANYGNYVVCDELLGVFDYDQAQQVSLYDQAQNCISDGETITSTPSGSVVGTANIRAVKYVSGTKGTSTARWHVYLFNINMVNGTSFARDVKSIFSSGSSGKGRAKADIVLEADGTAALKDASKNVMLFDFGAKAIRRLRDSNGSNDTQFVFRDIASATMAADGYVTFTINSPANGGEERLNNSVGFVSASGMSDFNITLSANAWTANLAGTVNCSGLSTALVGSGTSFTTYFSPGDIIRVLGTSAHQRRVVSVSNNTHLVMDSDIDDANTTAQIFKVYPAGMPIDFTSTGGTIQVVSNTQFIANTNLTRGLGNLGSGTQTVYAQYSVLRTEAVQAKKEIRRNRLVKIRPGTHSSGLTGPFGLGFTDVVKVNNIWVGNTYANTNIDRTTWFNFDNGQRDSIYEHAQLVLKPQFRDYIDANTRILVSLDYFLANTSTGIGFFSVDSYPIDDANTANTLAIRTAEIPKYYSTIQSRYVDLRNVVDYRIRRPNSSADATVEGSATENPVKNTTSFSLPSGGMYIAAPDTNFQADVEYYLPRVDLIVMNKEGDISVRQGEPNENPVAPQNEGDTTIVAEAYVTPYPSLTVREADSYGRRDISTKTRLRTNKGYTMKDIAALEARIERMEYYTTLNLLEQQAKDLVIPDENGLDRFKNGIFADSFRSHLLGRVDDFEYNISIDKDLGVARPKFKKHAVDFKFDSGESTGVVRTGHLLTLPYSNVVYSEQKFATKFRNCVESFWKWNGLLTLYPSYDHARDETAQPNIDVAIDLSAPWEQFVNSPFGTQFGEWRTSTQSSVSGNILTDVTTSTQVVNTIGIGSSVTNTVNLGSYVTDISMNPYMRSRLVAMVATGMKPNTRMHVHFERINVDAHCAPAALSGLSDFQAGREDRILNRTGEFGAPIFTDSNGNFYGIFRIPAETFRVGERELIVNNVENLVTGDDAALSSCIATYVASAISTGTRSSTISTTQPQLVFGSSVQTRVTSTSVAIPQPIINNITNVTNITNVVNENNWFGGWNGADGGDRGGDGGFDPISQTFLVRTPDRISGMFLTGIEVFFRSKDPVLGVEVWVVETTVGLPDTKRIIAKGRRESADVNTSSNASTGTYFALDNPIFVENEKDYAFLVKPDGNSNSYEIWCSEIGEFDVVTGEQVYAQPSSGVLTISSNLNTWTPLQNEDLKYKIYRAAFTGATGTATFTNEDDEYLVIDGFTKVSSNVAVQIGDVLVKLDGSNNRIVDSSNTDNYAYGVVQYIDEVNGIVHLDSSVGNLAGDAKVEWHRPVGNTANLAQLTSNTKIATSTVLDVQNIEYHMVVPRFAALQPSRTSLKYSFKGTDNTYTTSASYISVRPEVETEFLDEPRIAVSKSNEKENMFSNKSTFFKIDFASETNYLSPVIDMRRKASLFVENIINNDASGEHTRYGNAISKYVSSVITLDESIGDAEDILVYVGAYRPAGTDVKVYVKLLASNDGDSFDEKLWTPLVRTTAGDLLYSNPLNTADYREFKYSMETTAAANVGSQTTAYLANGVSRYIRSDGSIVDSFKQFAIKVVLTSENRALVPRLNDLRVIALQK